MTSDEPLVAVTGVVSYTGAAITDEPQRRGRRVRTLIGHPGRAPRPRASRTPWSVRIPFRAGVLINNVAWMPSDQIV